MQSTPKKVGCATTPITDSIFCETKPPAAQSHCPINHHANWCTWSKSFRNFLQEAVSELQRLAAPPLRRVESLDQYCHTYSWSLEHLRDEEIRKRFLSFV